MNKIDDDKDDLTLVYMWARKDADDEIKKLRAENERLREALSLAADVMERISQMNDIEDAVIAADAWLDESFRESE